jgi:hypothetical protein
MSARWSRACVIAAMCAGAGGCAQTDTMNTLAERYVKLVLAVGQHDADYVDAYYGPPEWRKEAEASKQPMADIDAAAADLLAELTGQAPAANAEEIVRLRHRYLTRQLEALRARVAMLQGTRLSFDEESKALYDATAPRHTPADFEKVLAGIERALPPRAGSRHPGEESLLARYEAFRNQFVIAPDRLDRVFRAAIEGCRSRTLERIQLPPGESFAVEYVTKKSWSAYNWYQGDYRSIIQVNTDLPIYIDRAIDLACHEGYPGHHVYNALLEKNLTRDRGWVEFSVYPLFSPQSLIAEGTANFGIEVAFPRAERLAFEQKVLFPEAGLDPSLAAQYYEVHGLVDQLSYAGNEAARGYLNGEIDARAAADWLEKYGLYSRPRAEQRVRFIDQYRSYVINYNLGKDMVAAHVAARGGTPDQAARRWDVFEELISSPRLPSGLATDRTNPSLRGSSDARN